MAKVTLKEGFCGVQDAVLFCREADIEKIKVNRYAACPEHKLEIPTVKNINGVKIYTTVVDILVDAGEPEYTYEFIIPDDIEAYLMTQNDHSENDFAWAKIRYFSKGELVIATMFSPEYDQFLIETEKLHKTNIF